MHKYRIRRVPIVDKETERCIGIITLDDLLREQIIGQTDTEAVLKAQLRTPSSINKIRRKSKNIFRAVDRREQSYYNFINHISTATNLSRGQARSLTLYLLTAFLKQITPQERKDLLSQLPYLLRTELLPETTTPQKSMATKLLVRQLSQRLQTTESETKAVMRAFWRALRELISNGETDEAATQLPREMRNILGV